MKYYTRKLIKPGDLNPRNTLFGGALLRWIDEEVGIHAMTVLDTKDVVTKFISEIDFVKSARQGDIIEIGIEFKKLGRTSVTFGCEVRIMTTKEVIIRIDNIVFVKVDSSDKPTPHGKSMDEIKQKI